ncbi:MAG: zinc-ribbon domain-containing protein [Prevotellaceae bacterium]|nr:zinc-ribbon domain-containing protein [Prevotellaceae bacterium]
MGKETKQCPYCGEEILSVAKKCKHCGEWLETTSPEPAKMIECPICGEEISEDADICPYCNEKVNSVSNVHDDDKHAAEDETDYIEEDVTEENEETSSEANTSIIPSIEKENNGNVVDNSAEVKRGRFSYFFVNTYVTNCINFKDTISRKQFWCGFLWYMFIAYAIFASIGWITIFNTDIIFEFDNRSSFAYWAYRFIYFAICIPSTAAAVRRLHDTGRSGWWVLISLIPIIGAIVLICLLAKKGKDKCERVQLNITDIIVLICGTLFIVIGIVGILRPIDAPYGNSFNKAYFENNYSEEKADSVEVDETNETAEEGSVLTDDMLKITENANNGYEYYIAPYEGGYETEDGIMEEAYKAMILRYDVNRYSIDTLNISNSYGLFVVTDFRIKGDNVYFIVFYHPYDYARTRWHATRRAFRFNANADIDGTEELEFLGEADNMEFTDDGRIKLMDEEVINPDDAVAMYQYRFVTSGYMNLY